MSSAFDYQYLIEPLSVLVHGKTNPLPICTTGHPLGDSVSSCWEVDYLQMKHSQLLQGDVEFSQTNSLHVLLVLHRVLGMLEPFSLMVPTWWLWRMRGCPQPPPHPASLYYSAF